MTALPPVPPPSQGPLPQAAPAHPSGKKRHSKYTGPIRFLIGLNVLLVTIAVVMGINAFSGGTQAPSPLSEDTGAQPNHTGDPLGESLAAGNPDVEVETEPETAPDPELTGVQLFTSPSKNISCEISALGARCDILTIDTEVQENPPGCTGTIGQVVLLTAQGTEVPCVEPLDGVNQDLSEYQELGYGEKIEVNNYLCASERTGVTCTDTTTNRGFSLARAGINTF